MGMVRIEQISKFFSEGRQNRLVLDNIQADIAEGEFVALLGRSGSGKSTLLNLMSGIEKPDTGDIWINDVAITRLTERERTLFRRDHIGFVFQFFNLIPTLTVLENITLPQELAGKKETAVRAHAMHLLDQIGLADRCDTFPDKLSGGEQQRVAIARALAHNPLLVLADEPTGNLDEDTGRRVLQLLIDRTRGAGKTLLMATHSPEIVPFADRVIEVHNGRLEERPAGTPQPADNGRALIQTP